jgi:hypothetical protein
VPHESGASRYRPSPVLTGAGIEDASVARSSESPRSALADVVGGRRGDPSIEVISGLEVRGPMFANHMRKHVLLRLMSHAS